MTTQEYQETTVLSMDEDLVSRKNQDGTVIVMRMDESNLFYKINGIAAEAWLLFEKHNSIKDVIDTIERKYNAPRDKIKNDVFAFIDKLSKMNIIAQ